MFAFRGMTLPVNLLTAGEQPWRAEECPSCSTSEASGSVLTTWLVFQFLDGHWSIFIGIYNIQIRYILLYIYIVYIYIVYIYIFITKKSPYWRDDHIPDRMFWPWHMITSADGSMVLSHGHVATLNGNPSVLMAAMGHTIYPLVN